MNTNYDTPKAAWYYTKMSTLIVFVLIFLLGLGMVGCPKYKVWQQGLEGKAELARAEQNRQIKIQEAKAKAESAEFEMAAEITRAKGVAKANEIIGGSLKGNSEYLHYLWINGLNDRQGEHTVVYVPTEANIPVMEAGRFGTIPK